MNSIFDQEIQCMKKTFVMILFVSTFYGCASPTVIQSVKAGDAGLTCPQLQNEYQDSERFKAEADKEKGLTGGNVARALLFWPAILGSFSNANEAIAAADTRKVHLVNLMNQKNCPIPGLSAPFPAPESGSPTAKN